MPSGITRRSIDNYQRLVAGYRRSVGKFIANYKSLAPKIDILCRLMEAQKLFTMTKKWGNPIQRDEVMRLFKIRSLGIFLQCRCDDSECSWANYDEGEDVTYCECIANNEMGCRGLFVVAFDHEGNVLGDEVE